MAELLPVVSKTNQALFAANNQIYVTVQNTKNGTAQYDSVNIILKNYFLLTGTFSFTFNLNGVDYTYSNTSVNTATTFAYSTILTDIRKNIFTVFNQNNLFDDYNMNVNPAGFDLVVTLTRTSFYKLDVSVTGYDATSTYTSSTETNINYAFSKTTPLPSYDTYITVTTKLTGDLVNLYDNVELGLDIYTYQTILNGGYLHLGTSKIASISKKRI